MISLSHKNQNFCCQPVRSFLVVCLLTCLMSACASLNLLNMEKFREDNKEHLQDLTIGMSKAAVSRAMGQRDIGQCVQQWLGFCTTVELINNPYRTASLSAGGQQYDIWSYYTDLKALDGSISEDELTPVVFENGNLVGWGRDYLQGLLVKPTPAP